MNKDLKFITLYPKVHMYKNVFKNVDDFLENAKKCENWEQWYTFGNLLALQESPIKFNNFPTKEEYIKSRSWQSQNKNDELRNQLTKEVGEIFYDVTNDFLSHYPEIQFSNWIKNPASINRYIDGAGVSDNYAMNYHTDFVQSEKDNPGIKFALTTTFYLNDTYDNGEICFKVNDEYISYKPEKGDVIVFPSSPPYYHAVRKATGSDRYMIRSFWQFDYDGSLEWLENEKKYGKDEWNKIEEERIKNNKFINQLDAEPLHKFLGKDNGVYL
jgi:signal peptidase I